MENYDSIFKRKEKEEQKTFSPFDKKAWAEKKQTERQQVYELIDETATGIANDGSLFKTALDVMARFDRYSVGNVLLIAAQMPEATKLADFDTWKQSGAYVRKGEDHVKLLEPGEEFKREDGSVGVAYNVKQVFDISQTSSKIRPPQVKTDMRILLKALIQNAPCAVEISDNIPEGVNAVYNDQEQKVLVRQGMDGQDIFRCLTNELTHAYLAKDAHYTRNNGAFTAYCASYTLCKRYGVETNRFDFKNVPGTLASMDTQSVRGQLAKVRDCVNQISTDITRSMGSRKKERSENVR